MPRARSTHPLAKLSDESPLPVYAVDDQRRIVSCNAACLRWLGMTVEQLMGQRCDYTTSETGSAEVAATAALCPPPQAFQGIACSGQVVWRNAAGQLEHRSATFVPLRSEEPAAVLAVLGELLGVEPASEVPTELASSEELHQRLQQLVHRMRARFRLDQLVGNSPAMRRVRDQVAAAISMPVRVLIIGPPGSGREHVARTIACGDKPENGLAVVPLKCGALDAETLMTSIAASSRRAKGATTAEPVYLLLEVDQLSAQLQVELATMLRSSTFRSRVLATAAQSLVELAESGSYDRELAHAISTLTIEIPPLRDRRDDIPWLIQRMVEEYNATAGRQLAGFAPAALDRLASLPWNGNVEELAAVVREACQAVSTVWIGEADLPARVRAVVSAGMHPRRELEVIQLDEFLLEIERELIGRAMQQAQGNKAQAARLLGVNRAKLLRRLEQLGFVSRPETTIDFQLEVDDDGPDPVMKPQLFEDE